MVSQQVSLLILFQYLCPRQILQRSLLCTFNWLYNCGMPNKRAMIVISVFFILFVLKIILCKDKYYIFSFKKKQEKMSSFSC